MRSFRRCAATLAWLLAATGAAAHGQANGAVLDEGNLAQAAFGADAPWYLENIPFLEIDDAALQRTYYYRWQLYRAHLREIGEEGVDVTEFLGDVPWARHPYTDLNDSSTFHILEGRWLRDPRLVASLVRHLYAGAGNDRHFSEAIAAATLQWTQVTGDAQPALQQLDAMQHIYNLWDDHFDNARNLYWIEPLLDATEYTISSIDASGAGFTDTPSPDQNRNGFTGGYAYRPSINAYQYANALAIAAFAGMAGQPAVASDYRARAARLRSAVLAQLWNPALTHFTDVYQRSTATVQAGNFIRGRELVGLVPWMFGLVPPNAPATPAAPGVSSATSSPDYESAWQHALRPDQLAGPYGLRTVEPTYPKYLQQYRYDRETGLRECQWNGPAWPFQIAQTLAGMANLLQEPAQHAVTREDYLHLLRQYTRLHALPDGTLDLQEDYDPDRGTPIVGLPRSHHYNHSTYNDLLLSGLLGLRPRTDDLLELNPLLPPGTAAEPPIRYFAVQHVPYHGRDVTVVYDASGSRYHAGAGLSVFANGRRIFGPAPLGHALIPLGTVPKTQHALPPQPTDLAVNVWGRAPSAFESDLPIATASSTAAGSNPYEAIDGRLWFFPQIVNGWSPSPVAGNTAQNSASQNSASQNSSAPWFAVDLRRARTVDHLDLAFAAGLGSLQAPRALTVQVQQNGDWQDVAGQALDTAVPLGNGITTVRFKPVQAQRLRVVMQLRPQTTLRLIELKAFGPALPATLPAAF